MSVDCIFCKIIAGEIPSYRIYEDKDYIAFLDVFPTHKGQVLVIPRKHISSKFTEASDNEICTLLLTSKKVAKQLEEKLDDVARVIVALEGLEIDHLHIKLYPTFNPTPLDYVLSSSGEKATKKELENLLLKLTS